MLISIAKQGMSELRKIKWNWDKIYNNPAYIPYVIIRWLLITLKHNMQCYKNDIDAYKIDI
jgi:hypothetical protein